MKTFIFALLVCLPAISFAQKDVCCVMSSVNGNNVTTSGDFNTDKECAKNSATTTYTGAKTICKSLPADSTECTDRGADAQKSRCSMCGFIWVDGACVVKDLEKEVEALKEKQKAEEEKKAEDQKKANSLKNE